MDGGDEKRSVMSRFHQVAGRLLGRTIYIQYQLSRDQGMVAGRVHSELESRIVDVLVSDGGLNTFGK